MSITSAETAARLIVAQISAVRIASRRVTGEQMKALHDVVAQACRIQAAVPWDRRVAAHAELFNVLADVVGDRLVAPVLNSGATLAYDLMAAAGPLAETMIVGSRSRFLTHLRAGDAYAAALEMEKHLSALYYMWQLADCEASAFPGAIA